MLLDDTEFNALNTFCKDFIDQKCIVRNTMMPSKRPGEYYSWMFYLRRGLFNRDFLHSISILFLDKVEKEIGHFDFQVSGLETASTPMLAVLPLVAQMKGINLHSFSIRKERKEYGLLNWIEGIPNNKPVMLIDDLCNSSMSMKKAYDILLKEKLSPFPYAYAIVNKVNKKVHIEKRKNTDMYLPENIRMLYQYDLDDFNLKNPSH